MKQTDEPSSLNLSPHWCQKPNDG